jgi:predicted nucleotidyltransferase
MENLQLTDKTFPKDILADIRAIEQILLQYGAEKVILYGSMARGDYRVNSDIDICVEGLPPQNYFRAFAACMMQAKRPMSVLDFTDTYGYLRERILEEGKIIAMSINKLREEIEFGLENLEKIHMNILKFSQQDTSEDIVIAALTYECFGYYNAIEHMIIRLLKYHLIEIPTGPFSHRDTLRTFYAVANDRGFKVDEKSSTVIENLMAFRHVATKIYSFLVDWEKLEGIIDDIKGNHQNIKQLFVTILNMVND